MEEQVLQAQKWISEMPHNDEIISEGKYCRFEGFVESGRAIGLQLLNLGYANMHSLRRT